MKIFSEVVSWKFYTLDLWLILVDFCRTSGAEFICIHMGTKLFQHHLLKVSFLHWVALHICQNQLSVSVGSYFLILILFHWSIHLFLCQYFSILISTASWWVKVSMILLTLFFFFKSVSTTLFPLPFHIHLRINICLSIKFPAGIVIGIVLNQ